MRESEGEGTVNAEDHVATKKASQALPASEVM